MYVYVVLEQNLYHEPNVTSIAAVYSQKDTAELFIETFSTLAHRYTCIECKVDSINCDLWRGLT